MLTVCRIFLPGHAERHLDDAGVFLLSVGSGNWCGEAEPYLREEFAE